MPLLTEQERQQVAAAIAAVEKNTDAEIVTVLARQADDYTYISLLWASLIALIVPSAANYFGEWLEVHQLAIVQWSCFIVLSFVFRLRWLTPRLIPDAVRYWRASNLARRQFLAQGLHRTKNATGVLIFVSEAERYVEILVDNGISSLIADEVWIEIVDDFTTLVKSGRTLEGFLGSIAACGSLLATQVPATRTKNELSNRLIILD